MTACQNRDFLHICPKYPGERRFVSKINEKACFQDMGGRTRLKFSYN